MKKHLSLSKLFIIAFTFLLILPMAAVVIFYLISVYDSNKDKTFDDIKVLSYVISGKINSSLEGTAMYLVSVAEYLGDREVRMDTEDLLESGIRNFDLLDNIYVLDEKKRITDLSRSNFNRYSQRDFKGIILSDVKGFSYFKPEWSRPFSSLLTNNYVVRVSVRFPAGYVVGDINLKFLADSLVKTNNIKNINVFMVDANGDVVSDSAASNNLHHENLFFHPAVQQAYMGNHIISGYEIDGVKYASSAYKIPIVDWYVILEMEQKNALSLFYNILYITMLAAMLACVFTIAVLLIIRKRLITPIKLLTANSRRLAEGEKPDFSIHETGAFSELNTLYESFIDMAQKREEREQELRNQEEYIRTVFDSTTNTGILVISTDDDPVITDANMGAQLILGYKASELIGLTPAALVRDVGEDITRMQREAQRRESMVTSRFEMTKKNGINFPVLCTAHPMIKSNVGTELVIVVFIDITEITRVQNALESEKERLDVTLKSIGEGVVAADKYGRITLVNSSAENILGQKHRYIMGYSVKDVLQIYDVETGDDLSYILTSETNLAKRNIRANIISDDKGLVTVVLTASAMLNQKGEAIGFVYVFRDITDSIKIDKELMSRKRQLEEINRNLEIRVSEEAEKRRKNEQLLFEQAKFAAMGQMISAIAHQWRQPLNALALYTQDIEDAYEMDEVDEEYLKSFVATSMNLIKHMSGTIDDFRNFFHSSNVRERVNIVYVMAKSIELIATQLRNQNINYELIVKNDEKEDVFLNSMPPDDAEYGRDVVIYPSEMKQVLLNIIQNARDAISDKRKNIITQSGNIFINIEYKADKVIVAISNDGGVIPDDSLTRIFDPYYTTKPEGEGTGIGLYMSKTMVEDHIGGLLMAENVEHGAKFTITIYYDN